MMIYGYVLLLFGLFIFAPVVIHEIGHVVAIRYYGHNILQIHCNPITAGVKWDDSQATPKELIVIALAGIIANALAVAALYIMYIIYPHVILHGLIAFNLMLIVISILPIQGADGYKAYHLLGDK